MENKKKREAVFVISWLWWPVVGVTLFFVPDSVLGQQQNDIISSVGFIVWGCSVFGSYKYLTLYKCPNCGQKFIKSNDLFKSKCANCDFAEQGSAGKS